MVSRERYFKAKIWMGDLKACPPPNPPAFSFLSPLVSCLYPISQQGQTGWARCGSSLALSIMGRLQVFLQNQRRWGAGAGSQSLECHATLRAVLQGMWKVNRHDCFLASNISLLSPKASSVTIKHFPARQRSWRASDDYQNREWRILPGFFFPTLYNQ